MSDSLLDVFYRHSGLLHPWINRLHISEKIWVTGHKTLSLHPTSRSINYRGQRCRVGVLGSRSHKWIIDITSKVEEHVQESRFLKLWTTLRAKMEDASPINYRQYFSSKDGGEVSEDLVLFPAEQRWGTDYVFVINLINKEENVYFATANATKSWVE